MIIFLLIVIIAILCPDLISWVLSLIWSLFILSLFLGVIIFCIAALFGAL